MDIFAIVFTVFIVICIAGLVIGMVTTGGLFVGIATLFGLTLQRAAAENAANDASPILEVRSKVAAKRTQVSGMEHTTTRYYATFEYGSSARTEFAISGQQYGMLAEGDHGVLRHQGTRYLGFVREGSEN